MTGHVLTLDGAERESLRVAVGQPAEELLRIVLGEHIPVLGWQGARSTCYQKVATADRRHHMDWQPPTFPGVVVIRTVKPRDRNKVGMTVSVKSDTR